MNCDFSHFDRCLGIKFIYFKSIGEERETKTFLDKVVQLTGSCFDYPGPVFPEFLFCLPWQRSILSTVPQGPHPFSGRVLLDSTVWLAALSTGAIPYRNTHWFYQFTKPIQILSKTPFLIIQWYRNCCCNALEILPFPTSQGFQSYDLYLYYKT